MPSAPDNPQSDPPAADDSFRALAARAPFSIFAEWFADARRADPEGACAATLATTDGDGQAQARTVLVKDFADDELPFFTNLQSRKARALAANPRAALLFFWRGELPARQALFEGECAPIERARAAAYFASRPRESQIGAWASRQSQPLADFADLTARVEKTRARFAAAEVSLPPFWGGFSLRPTRIEFWREGGDRLHRRLEFARAADGGWRPTFLHP